MNDFEKLFNNATTTGSTPKGFTPHPWQSELADESAPINRLIRIPTGMGKTLGVLTTWLYHRLEKEDTTWPTRLVWCLPMRTLVEQTTNEAEKLLASLNIADKINVHTLMGGVEEQRWYQNPERPAILVGTQDMLLSRALNRGYAMGRAAWPRAFGLLNTDCLWVMDEIQLMGVGLTTSAQIQAFWGCDFENRVMVGKPRVTWWMSATLQPDWLRSPETAPLLEDLQDQLISVHPKDRVGDEWDAKKPVEMKTDDAKEWGQMIREEHEAHSPDPKTGRQTLVVVNTVKQATELYKDIQKQFKNADLTPEIVLIHSRFRHAEREMWVEKYLSRQSLNAGTNRILIATQVVEAGVDISVSCLFTELAPWPSLVQRFGRAARYGGESKIIVLDREHTDDKKSAPYTVAELNAARKAINQLTGVSLTELEDFEAAADDDTLAKLYPFEPVHVILQHEFEELFDTSPDLSGADIDISRFIREGDERNVQVFWRQWADDKPDESLQPQRRELCPVAIGDAKKWLKDKNRVEYGQQWTWDYLNGTWQHCDVNTIRPGQVILVSPKSGGYDPERGFTGEKTNKKIPIESVDETSHIKSVGDNADSTEAGSEQEVWKTIATHCREGASLAEKGVLAFDLDKRLAKILPLVMRLHDWGKAHPAFANGTYKVEPLRADLAKAPHKAWRSRRLLYSTKSHGPRRGFRHELASCLATLELLRSADPDHPAILGNYRELLVACGMEPELVDQPVMHPIADELKQLSESDFNLLLYLIASHHGKVRCSMQASPVDQDFPMQNANFAGTGMPIRGVRDGDSIPEIQLPLADGTPKSIPETFLSLQPAAMGLSPRYGASWTERVQSLMTEFGPFTLSWLEAFIRAIDGRASDDSSPPGSDPDPLLKSTPLTVPVDSDYGRSNESDDGQLVQAEKEMETTHV